MIVVCPSCSSRFQYDEARFQGAATKRFRCPKCSTIFDVQHPQMGTPVPSGAPTPAPISGSLAIESPSQEVASAGGPNLTQPFPSMVQSATTARRDREDVLQAAGLKDSLPPNMRFSLAFLSGPHASTVKVLEQPVLIIGREEGDILTQDPETSRRHARLEVHWDGSVWLTDLNSTNGTFVEGRPVSGTVRLLDRQEFACGKSTFMLLVRQVEDEG